MGKYTVYCHVSPSGKKYVGITSTTLEKRWSKGRGYKNNKHFWRAIQKYGWDNFKHIVLFEYLTYEQASDLERSLIEILELTNPQNGYNISNGNGCGFSEETRRRMSESQKGNKNSVGRILTDEEKYNISKSLKQYYAINGHPCKGRKLSEEEIEKLKNRKISEETRRKMIENHADVKGAKNPSAKAVFCIDTNDGTKKFYPYASLAANELNIDLSSIIKCCKGKIKKAGGFVWEYADVTNQQIKNEFAA